MPPAHDARTTRGTLAARVFTTLVITPPVLAAVWAGTPWFEALMVAAAVQAGYEWQRMCDPASPRLGIGLAAAGGLMVLGAVLLGRPAAAASAAVAGLAVWAVLSATRRREAGPRALGLVYLTLPFILAFYLRGDAAEGWKIFAWVVAVVAATDIGAYFAGRAIGGARLAPRTSPSKTWAGAVGGTAAGGAVGLAASAWVAASPLTALAAAVAIAVSAQVGDLAESFAKRHFRVKDSGGLLPGHGGLLDRIDGLLWAVPVCAALVWARAFEAA